MKNQTYNNKDDAAWRQSLERWVEHGLSITVGLVQPDGQRRPTGGFCSGFLIERNGKLYVLSAGHGLAQGEWNLQTNVADHAAGQSILVPLRGGMTLKKIVLAPDGTEGEEVDFAWC